MTKLSEFIAPCERDEFDGELGITAEEIARSLETEPRVIRQKLRDRGFIDRIEAQGFRAITIGMVNKVNGLQFDEILLDSAAAKFFVGKYDSAIGDAYLAFLIRMETRVNTVLAEAAKELYRVSCSNEERTMQPWDELSKALKNLDELNRR